MGIDDFILCNCTLFNYISAYEMCIGVLEMNIALVLGIILLLLWNITLTFLGVLNFKLHKVARDILIDLTVELK